MSLTNQPQIDADCYLVWLRSGHPDLLSEDILKFARRHAHSIMNHEMVWAIEKDMGIY
jgi:hypothetical protein